MERQKKTKENSDFQQNFQLPKKKPTDQVPMMESDSNFYKSSKNPKTSHGGIINQFNLFKAPAQTTEEGIVIKNWKSRTGQQFTSLKKL